MKFYLFQISDNLMEQVTHAESAVKSLPYHLNMDLVRGIVKLASDM